MAQDDWKEIRSKFEGLGLKLKLHLEQENDDANDSSKPGDTKAAVEELGEKLQEAFSSFGTAAKDPAVRSDVKEIGTLLKDAMVNTFGDVGAEVGDSLKRAGDRVNEKTGERFNKPPPPSAADSPPSAADSPPSAADSPQDDSPPSADD